VVPPDFAAIITSNGDEHSLIPR